MAQLCTYIGLIYITKTPIEFVSFKINLQEVFIFQHFVFFFNETYIVKTSIYESMLN